MKPNEMKSNEDLYEFVYSLAQKLNKRGQQEMASKLTVVCDFAYGSPSEFLHEAECALKDVCALAEGMLEEQEKSDINFVIRKIDKAFKNVGGA